MNEAKNFNLIEEPWVPVMTRRGDFERLGIEEVLARADRIRSIAAGNPMDKVAILRFLIALLYWCRGSPSEESGHGGELFTPDCFRKLNHNRERFNLFGQGKRFYQTGNAERPRPATDLLQEIPTGHNAWHFLHSIDGVEGLCPYCCVLGLLRLPLFSVSGLPDLKAGINGAPPIYVIPCGETLRETLLFNWSGAEELGEPSWLNPEMTLPSDEAVPVLPGLTLLARKVWLHDAEGPGVCVGCGAHAEQLVHSCEFQSAGKQETELWQDPHVIYYTSSKKRRTPYKADDTVAGNLRTDRPWHNMLIGALGSRHDLFEPSKKSLLVVGFATQQAKNVDVWERTIPPITSSGPCEEAAAVFDQWIKQGLRIEKQVGRAKLEGKATITSIRPSIDDRVSSLAPEMISGADDAWERAAALYRPMMEAVAKSLSPGYTSRALRGRRHIAETAPLAPSRKKDKPEKKGGAK